MTSYTRYERKFIIEQLQYQEVINIIKINPFMFNYIYKQRNINNIYFDTPDYRSYQDNIDGNLIRSKYRIRWYGDLLENIAKPIFEIKNKFGNMGTKETHSIDGFKLRDIMDSEKLKKILKNKDLPQKIQYMNLIPTLINRYSRIYFQTFDRKYRITLDCDLAYCGIRKNSLSFINDNKEKKRVILELKYSSNYDNYVDKITQHFPFRMTKCSKYVTGIEKSL